MSDWRVSDDPAWQPYSDPTTGEVVTVTPQQCAAVMHAVRVWLAVAEREGYAAADAIHGAIEAAQLTVYTKSCLLGRLLYDGKAPLVDAPPTVWSAPDYSVEVTS